MNESTVFSRVFARRSSICFFMIIFLFLTCILRVAATATADLTAVQKSCNTLRLTAGRLRGTIYDCNMVPLTNNRKRIIAAISPTPRAITAISAVLEGEALENALQRLKGGKPILCEVPREIKCDGISCTLVYSTEYEQATHILGYTDSDNKGISGIEAAFDEQLYSENEVAFSYEATGNGGILEGIAPTVSNDTSIIAGGVVTTLDTNIQSVAEAHAKHIETGAVVIAEAKSGKIKAMVSRPDFKAERIVEYLNEPDSPLLNRAINAYNVGSVFKPCVAAAGIEQGLGGFCYSCTGSCEIIDRFFKCHKREGHGYMNLRTGIANSCNTYFYNFAFTVGAESIYKTASSLKFGKAISVCKGISTAEGSLPDVDSLSNIAHLANFSIGQGELLLSPVSMLTLYSAIASDGKYYNPYVVEGTLKNGSFNEYNKGLPTRAMKPETAAALREYLAAVLTEGTGEEAKPKSVSAAGKTATAQTGKYKNGIEICEGWFCGFFPAESPEYVVIVFSENTLRQTATCSKVFSLIADSITALNE